MLFLTEQAADKVQERISLALWKGATREHCFSNLDFWKWSRWVTLTIPLSLWIGSSFTFQALSAKHSMGVSSPSIFAILQYPLLWTLKMFKGMVYVTSLCPCWPIQKTQWHRTPHNMKQDQGNCCQVSSSEKQVVAHNLNSEWDFVWNLMPPDDGPATSASWNHKGVLLMYSLHCHSLN